MFLTKTRQDSDKVNTGQSRAAAYAGLFLLSLALLMIEIVYSRTARVSFGYEYQLLVISLAISGLGLGGIPVFYLFKRLNQRFNLWLAPLALVFAVSLPLPFLTVNSLGVEYAANNVGTELTYFGVSTATMTQFSLAVFGVYFVAGVLIAAFLSHYGERVSSVYALNLTGSAAGALAVVPLMNLFGTETTVVIIYAVALTAAALFAARSGLKPLLIGALVVVSLITVGLLGRYAPALRAGGTDSKAVVSASNSFSQIDVFRVDPTTLAKGLSASFGEAIKPSVKAYSLVYDRKLKTNAIVYANLADVKYLTFDLFYFPYYLKPRSDVLIIGAGGGVDVARARLAESRTIDAVEVNPLMIDIARNRLKTKAFDGANVRLHVGEARNFVTGSKTLYDLIFLSNTGGFGGRSVNSNYYPDNYLHTTEAYDTYLNHLGLNGILAVSNKDMVVREFVGVGIAALARKGISAAHHVALLSGHGYSVVLLKPAGFSRQEERLIAKKAAHLNFSAEFPATLPADAVMGAHITDDKPFLSDKTSLVQILSARPAKSEAAAPVTLPGAIALPTTNAGGTSEADGFLAIRFLAWLGVAGLAGVLLLLALPPLFPAVRAARQSLNLLLLLGYFVSLGLGFIVFQVVMLQRAFLFIGNPSYSLVLVLASFLLFGGLGSLVTARLKPERFRLAVVCAGGAVTVFLLVYSYLLNRLFVDLIYLSPAGRAPLLVLLLAGPCWLAGLLFPIGLKMTNAFTGKLIPWMWSINGVAVVLGGAVAALLSFFYGFRITLGAAAGFYLIAAILFAGIRNMSLRSFTE